jgi:translocation and assembly module TamB
MKRWLGRFAASAALSAVLAFAIVLGTVVHAGLPVGRRVAAAAIGRALDAVFAGRVAITAIERADPLGVGGVDLTVDDPAGRRVLSVTGLMATAHWPAFALSVLRGDKDLSLLVSRASAKSIVFDLRLDDASVPTIARAFTPRPRPISQATAPAGPQPRVLVELPRIQIGTVRVTAGTSSVVLANVSASVRTGSERTEIRIDRSSVDVEREGLSGRGTARGLVQVPSPSGGPVRVWGTLDGYAGDVPVAARVLFDGGSIDVELDVVRAEAAAVRALVPLLPVAAPVSVHLTASGKLPELDVRAFATVGDGWLLVIGKADLARGVSLDVAVEAGDVDLRSIDATLPDVRASAAGRVFLDVQAGQALRGTASLRTSPFVLFGTPMPAAGVDATFDSSRLDAAVVVNDSSLAAQGKVTARYADGLDVDFDVQLDVPRLSRLPWLASVGSGGGAAHVRGKLARGELDARVDGRVSQLCQGAVCVMSANVSGSVRGALDRPTVSGMIDAADVHVGPIAFSRVQANVSGSARALSVEASSGPGDGPEVRARATLHPGKGGVALSDVRLDASRDRIMLTAKADAVHVSSDRIDVDGLRLDGAGAPLSGSMHVSEASAKVHLEAKDLDVSTLVAVLMPGFPVGGHVSLSADFEVGGQRETAHVALDLSGGQLFDLSPIAMQADVGLDGRKAAGGVNAVLGTLGTITATAVDANLAGPMLRAASYQNATGTLLVNASVDLAEVSRRVPGLFGLVTEASGNLSVRGQLVRSQVEGRSPIDPPTVDLVAWTDDLKAKVRGDVRADDFDLQLGTHVDGVTGQSETTLRVVDAQGVFASATLAMKVHVLDLLARPQKMIASLAATPVSVHVSVPRRALTAYPAIVRPSALVGEVEADATLSGLLLSPRVTARVNAYGFGPRAADLAPYVDVEAEGGYDGQQALVRLTVHQGDLALADGSVEVSLPLASLIDPAKRASGWEAQGMLTLERLPLASIPALANRDVRGDVSGALAFSGMNRDPTVQAQVTAHDVRIGGAEFPGGTALLRIAGDTGVLSAVLTQKGGEAGLTATGRVVWATPIAPAVDFRAPADVYLALRDVRAAALYPLFDKLFTHLDGRMNGNLHLHQEPTAAGPVHALEGTFELTEGTFEVPQIGQDFRDARANIVVAGSGAVVVSDLSARATTGLMTGSAVLQMRGLSFESGEASLFVEKKTPIPLTIEGVSFGDAWGTITARAKRTDARTIGIDFDVPVLHADLPQAASRAVQALADNPSIVVGMQGRDKTFVPLALGPPAQERSADALLWHLVFHLGKDVVIKRGSMLELSLGGEPVVDLSDTARLSGAISLTSGKLEILGKQFQIEHGVARFERADAGNPEVAVTARWETPDGTKIFADYIGPLRSGKLSFRSEPSLPQSDIMAILLFGVSGTGGSDTGQDNSAKGLVAGGAAATDLANEVLAGALPVPVATRLDTSDAANPTPEVAVQISPQVTAEVSYRTSPDVLSQRQDRVCVTVDWKFHKNWSVVTKVGDQGSSVVDLLWQYRY